MPDLTPDIIQGLRESDISLLRERLTRMEKDEKNKAFLTRMYELIKACKRERP